MSADTPGGPEVTREPQTPEHVVIYVSPGYALFLACRAFVEAVGCFIRGRKVRIEVWADLT